MSGPPIPFLTSIALGVGMYTLPFYKIGTISLIVILIKSFQVESREDTGKRLEFFCHQDSQGLFDLDEWRVRIILLLAESTLEALMVWLE